MPPYGDHKVDKSVYDFMTRDFVDIEFTDDMSYRVIERELRVPLVTIIRTNVLLIMGLRYICNTSRPVTGEFPALRPWRGTLMFSLICPWTNGWISNRDAGDLKRHRAHCVTFSNEKVVFTQKVYWSVYYSKPVDRCMGKFIDIQEYEVYFPRLPH